MRLIIGLFLLALSTGVYAAECNDSIDNDGDGLIDWGNDYGCTSSTDDNETGVNFTITDGWTEFEPSGDSRVVFVSDTDGDDADSGLTPALAKKTVAAGFALLRDGYPDWMLLKRGDVWTESIAGGSTFKKSGRSATEPMLIGAYGTSSNDRPRLDIGASQCFGTVGSGGSPTSTDYLVFNGIFCNKHTRDPDHPSFNETHNKAMVYWLRGTQLLYLEDMKFQWGELSFNSIDGYDIDNVTIRRTQVLDSWARSSVEHAQGIFIRIGKSFTLDQVFFDHNGWNSDIASGGQTIFNHNIYTKIIAPLTIKDSLVMRGSSHGVQARQGGTIERNIWAHNPISILLDMKEAQSDITDNVLIHGNNIGASTRGWGIQINNDLANAGHVVDVTGNLTTQCITGGSCFNYQNSTSGVGTVNYSSNIIFDWSGSQSEDADTFTDSGRDLEAYEAIATPGGTNDIDEFSDEMRAQSRMTWDTDYEIPKIHNWIRVGFDMETLDGGDASPSVSAGNDKTITQPTDSVASESTFCTDDVSATMTWSNISKPGGSGTPTYTDDVNDVTVTFGNLDTAGAYVFQASCDDGVNAAVTDTMTVTVQEEEVPQSQCPPVGLFTLNIAGVEYMVCPEN